MLKTTTVKARVCAAALLSAALLLSLTPCSAAQAAQGRQVTVPVLMYHSILQSKQKQGRYTIGPDALEADLNYLKEQGYTTVVAEDLVRFVEDGVPLPEKPVMITFDDGHYNNVTYAEPLLEQYGMRAVIFVVGAFCEKSTREGEQNPNYSYVSWDTLRGMAERGIWDIQSHTWDMHDSCGKRYGIRRMKGESESVYMEALRKDATDMAARLQEVTGKAPVAFAYPFGCRSAAGDEVLKELGYHITFGCEDKQAVLTTGQPECLLGICRLLRSNNRPASMLLGGGR